MLTKFSTHRTDAAKYGRTRTYCISFAAAATTSSVKRFTVPSWSSLPHTPQAQPVKPLNGGNSSKVGRVSGTISLLLSMRPCSGEVRDSLGSVLEGDTFYIGKMTKSTVSEIDLMFTITSAVSRPPIRKQFRTSRGFLGMYAGVMYRKSDRRRYLITP